MSQPVDFPLLRWGQEYWSLDHSAVNDIRTGAELARLGQANSGLIQSDLKKAAEARQALEALTVEELLRVSEKAAELFVSATLPIGRSAQSPDDYVRQLSASSGLPHSLVRSNMQKLHTAMTGMRGILKGLMRGLPLELINRGWSQQDGLNLSYSPTTDALGIVLPSNSPGVNSIWLPAIALRTPVVIKPGREEPWTPFRLIQALIAAGCPKEAFCYWPTSHEGADIILRRCGRGIIFGDDKTTAKYAANSGIERHGTGRSKVILGEDLVDRWPDYLDLIFQSIVSNGGRSCVNASAIITPRHADEIGAALAERLAAVRPLANDHPEAILSAFANPAIPNWLDSTIEQGLKTPGAIDLTAVHRASPRLQSFEGAQYMLPTLIRCQSFEHPLANTEMLFPFASLTEIPQNEVLQKIGPSLVVSLITEDSDFMRAAAQHPHVDRLNLGALPTTRVEWDQPHEGNLFEHLYRRRAVQRSA